MPALDASVLDGELKLHPISGSLAAKVKKKGRGPLTVPARKDVHQGSIRIDAELFLRVGPHDRHLLELVGAGRHHLPDFSFPSVTTG